MRAILRAAGVATVSALVAVTTVVSPAPAATTPRPHGSLRSDNTIKTLVVGIDGATISAMTPENTPTIHNLMVRGTTATSNLYAKPMAATSSGPGWSTILTGVWPDKHWAINNSFIGTRFYRFPDYLTRIEKAAPQRSTLAATTWKPIVDRIVGRMADEKVGGGKDVDITATVVDRLTHGNPDDIFVQLDEVDGAGHSHGSRSPEYAKALKKADSELGEILEAVEGRATSSQEDWLVVVMSDHGHTPTGGHGGDTPLERGTFVIAAGPGIQAGVVSNQAKLVDIAPTVLATVGIEIQPSWGLDGEHLGNIAPDDFDALLPELRTQVDETSPGVGVRGWTQATPDGWSVDNSRMPAGGVTEWRGWSFTTDEFWTNVERGQRRETAVRNRNVFAVADSDEWDDRPHDEGWFDSTLISPAYAVEGLTTVDLEFASTHVIDGPQTAEVLVSFDEDEPTRLAKYYVGHNRVERLRAPVPEWAESVRFHFHYAGKNSAFWTVDRVAVSAERIAVVAGKVAVAGVPAVDSRLRAVTTGWFPSSVSLSHQWLRDGVAIPGATAPKYRVSAADAGSRLSVTVTGSVQGLPPVSVTSESTSKVVAKSRPKVVLVTPTTSGPFRALDLRIDATADAGLKHVVGKIYRDGERVKTTKARFAGERTGTHTALVELPDGTYTLRYFARDVKGRVSQTGTHEFVIDTTG